MKIFMATAAILLTLLSLTGLKDHKVSDFIAHEAIATLNIDIDAIGMDKEECKDAADSIVSTETIIGMSKMAVAKEIYAHIAIHNIIESLPNAIKNFSIVNRINNSTLNGIDLEDYGDTFLRRIAYDVIWVVVR